MNQRANYSESICRNAEQSMRQRVSLSAVECPRSLAALVACIALGCSGSGGAGGLAEATGGTADSVGGSHSAGGSRSTGGAKASTGTASVGGSAAAGGATVTGGSNAAGGSSSTGASLSTGGATGVAGAKSAGGATATGGAASTGGVRTTGGAPAFGGAPPAGGTSSTGGASASSADLWISPSGSDSNAGAEASPLATLAGAQSKWSAGKTIWVKPGTYSWAATQKLTKAGTAASPIKVFAAAGARPVIDFSGQAGDTSTERGLQISGSYWYLKGFDVMNAGDNCIYISGSNNTIEWVTVHGCGCRSWNNADDGWDLYAAPAVVVIENCWAFFNGKLPSGGGTSNGDGNGFKLGGAGGGAAHQVTRCFAMENLACGFTRNNNTEVPVLSQCGGRSDGKGEYCSLTNSSAVSSTMMGAQAKAVQRNSDGSLPAIK